MLIKRVTTELHGLLNGIYRYRLTNTLIGHQIDELLAQTFCLQDRWVPLRSQGHLFLTPPGHKVTLRGRFVLMFKEQDESQVPFIIDQGHRLPLSQVFFLPIWTLNKQNKSRDIHSHFMSLPHLLTLLIMIDFTRRGAVFLTAAAVAILQPWRLAVVCILRSDVAAMTALVFLHLASAAQGAVVTFRTSLGAAKRDTNGTFLKLDPIHFGNK